MGLPKIPDAKEIADMTAQAMQPMMDQLQTISDQLDRLIDIQTAQACAQGVAVPGAKRLTVRGSIYGQTSTG